MKKVISMFLALIVVFSVICPGVSIISSATEKYSQIDAIRIPRIVQPKNDNECCWLASAASVQAYRYGYYNSRVFEYGTDYSIYEEELYKDMKFHNDGKVGYGNGAEKYYGFFSKNIDESNYDRQLIFIYEQLKKGNPVLIRSKGYRAGTKPDQIKTSNHVSVIIGYSGNTSKLEASGFTLMEVGYWRTNSQAEFDKFANNPQNASKSKTCYITLESWLANNIPHLLWYINSSPTNKTGGRFLKKIDCDKYMTVVQSSLGKVTLKEAPYSSSTTHSHLENGTTVHIKASYINIFNRLWYQTAEGYWIYGERLTEKPQNTITYQQSKSTNQKKTKEKIVLPNSAVVIEDQDYTIPAEIPIREGHKFMGWALTEDAKEAQFQAGEKIFADVFKKLIGKNNVLSLYPVWKQTKTTMEIDKYEINLNVSDSSNLSTVVVVECTGDLKNAHLNMNCSVDNESVVSTKSTYAFLSQFLLRDKLTNKFEIKAEAPGTSNVKIELYDTNDKLLISKSIFVKVDASYIISYYDDTDGKIAKNQTKKYNKDIELLDFVPEKEGYIFLGWTTTAGSSTVEYGPGDKYEGNKNLALFPVWKEKYEIKYDFNNGVLRIYGKGDMASYPTGKTPWASYSSQITEIKIELGVTSIGSNAFANFTNLAKVSMPYGITKIGAKAFYGCKNLVSINFPASVSIGNRAFANCSKLKEVTMPGATTQALSTQSATEVSIGAFAFENCVSLASVDVPDTVTDIGAGAFTGCAAMESFEIPKGVEVINDSTFFGCSGLENINIPSGVTQIGDGAFSVCSAAETIVISDTVDSIGDQAFSGCSVVTEVDIPESVDTIGAGVFTNCSALTNVDLPDDIEYIGEGMFSGCSALGTLEIPQTVSYIGDGAFGYCSSLTGVEIPENVSEINNSTFYGCSSLKSFEVPATVVSIGDYAFGDCDNLKHVTISEGTASIGVGAFAFCDTLETVSVPASLTLIDDGAFMDCASLTNIDLLESELVIGEDAFYGCSSLADIQLPERIISIGDGAFDCCSADFSLSCFSTSSVYEQVVDTYDNVEVINPVSGVTLDKSEVGLLVGQTLNLNATVAPANATCKDIIWSSNNPDYVSVDENGLVTAIKTGTVVITATTNDNLISAQCEITVTVPVKSIEIVDEELSGYVEENMQIYFNIEPNNSTNISVSWISSDESIATVNDNGEVLLLSPGEVTITAITEDGGFTDSCIIKSEEFIMPTGVNLAEKNIEMTVGEVRELQAQTVPSNTSFPYIFWESEENTDIIEVSQDGIITALKEGTATVYAYAGSFDGPVEACSVTVLPNSSSSNIEICKPSVTTINYGDAIILHVDGTVPAGARIEWTASNGNFSMSVSADGTTCKISPKSSGKTVFTATVYDKDGNLIGTDTQEMTAKAGLWQKIVAFFKKIFGLTKTFPEAFKGIL